MRIMNKSARSKTSAALTAGSSSKPRPSAGPRAAKRAKKSKIDIAIASELAPAAAIAVLDKSTQAPDSPAPALDVLVAGVSEATEDGKVRVQLMFDSGAVLPVEMSAAAGKALEAGLAGRRAGKNKK
jgi:hypothetical protein